MIHQVNCKYQKDKCTDRCRTRSDAYPMYRSRFRKAAFEEYGETLEGAAEAIWQYNKAIVDSIYDLIPAVKPQIAMYEQFGIPGLDQHFRKP